MKIVTRASINNFMTAKRIAVIGSSRSQIKYSRMLFRELLKHDYDVIPVNPNAEEIDGIRCFKKIGDISPVPERALIILPEELTEQAVLDCAAAGVKDVWLHRHVAGGVSDTRAICRADEKGVNLITGYCMFMFLPMAPLFHKFHGSLLKIIGKYPK
ncbi:MAG TPA: CoA-binding protein [Geobacteraceae bacterium]|nr:CoA-binding protein [Geobacteraceae bacterium]